MSAPAQSPALPPSSAATESAFPALRCALGFVRHNVWAVALCSVVVLAPCFWHRHIEANDLGSHVYNAWLAQLIHQGKAPGLHLVPQSNNVLFDLMLSELFRLGPRAAERIAVSVAVLIFFWGGFALCAAAAGRASWAVAPVLAMTAYGFVFNMGFFNLYLSVGLSLFVLALAWRGRRWDMALDSAADGSDLDGASAGRGRRAGAGWVPGAHARTAAALATGADRGDAGRILRRALVRAAPLHHRGSRVGCLLARRRRPVRGVPQGLPVGSLGRRPARGGDDCASRVARPPRSTGARRRLDAVVRRGGPRRGACSGRHIRTRNLE